MPVIYMRYFSSSRNEIKCIASIFAKGTGISSNVQTGKTTQNQNTSKSQRYKIFHRSSATTITSVVQELPLNCKLLTSEKLLLPIYASNAQLCVCCWPTSAQ